ncbi:MAG: DNA primase [Actinobacteria bacterium]|nr:MAG: DNA primase [Actinomycetota bacterium]
MARQSSHRPDADKPDTATVDPEPTDDESVPAAEDADATPRAGTGDRTLWESVRIDPVSLALPDGVGYTLRAYRPANEVTPTDVSGRDDEDPFEARAAQAAEEDDEAVVILDEEFAKALEEEEAEARVEEARDKRDDDTRADSDGDEEQPASTEEIPVFLSHRGRLLLFKTPESLVNFVRSGAANDLSQVDTWKELVERLEPIHINPLPEDDYELDLVVENLRGGHDAWDPTLLIKAGEIARDLAYALRLPSVLEMLAPGSSLDDLDEALRATVNGGFAGFIGRRRLKKIGAQTASLGWRTIIGKISSVVDWRD